MIITDNHMHLYNHLRLDALKQFKRAGGTHVFIVSLLAHHYNVKPTKGDDFKEVFDAHIKLVEQGKEIVQTHSILGIHPAEITIIGGKGKLSFEKAVEIMKSGLEIAGKYVQEGKAVAIKSGRPHYPVSDEIWKLSNEVLLHAFEVANDVGCPIQLHTESFTIEGMKEIAELADEAGLPRKKVIKHFSPPAIDEFEKLGLFPSVLASRENVIQAAKQGTRFVVETDYIDDKKRPGSVLGPKTVPKKMAELIEQGYESTVYKVCKENPEKLYSIEMEEK